MESILVNWRKRGLVMLGISLVLSIALLVYLGSENNALALSADTPNSVIVGKPFELSLLVRNTTDSPQTLVSIGLENTLVEQGLVVVDISPNYREIQDAGRWQEYTFSLQRRPVLEPNTEIALKLELVATRTGDYDGEITVWLKNHLQAQHLNLTFHATE